MQRLIARLRHGKVRRLLSPYLDARVSNWERRLVEAHVGACPSCRTELDQLRATVAVLREVGERPLLRSFALTQAQVAQQPVRTRTAPMGVLRYATASLVLLLALVIAGDLWRTSTDGGAMTRTAAPSMQSAPIDATAPAGEAVRPAAAPVEREAASATEGVQKSQEPAPTPFISGRGLPPDATPAPSLAPEAQSSADSKAAANEDEEPGAASSALSTGDGSEAAPVQGEARESTLDNWPFRQIEMAIGALLLALIAGLLLLRRKVP